SSNPLEKIGRYFAAGKIRSSFTKILEQLKSFTETSSNLYGMKINNTKVKDQFLVSIKESLNKAPANSTIYSLIEELEYYINQQNAKPTAHPMLHVDSSNTKYEVMVAIPVNKPLQGNSRIQPKRMVLGNILEAEVKGGPEAIKKGKIELNNYREDYDRTSPAIPYESLVTNRLQERDSSKWITRLYYPVF
ncbi:MAG TPA: hypothetical protein VM368_09060, partial [Flavisolibacter sp.]|nr:hypothetical protein [Flavisolibacter sp.]